MQVTNREKIQRENQPGYKTLKTEQINTTQATRTVQPPDTKTPKPTKWEKGNIFPNRMQAHQPLGTGVIAKLSGLRTRMWTSKIKIESSRGDMNTLQLSSLNYARDKRPRGCPGVHVRFLPTGKYLHSLSLPLTFSSAFLFLFTIHTQEWVCRSN